MAKLQPVSTKELREIKARRRVVEASLDLSYAIEDIVKKRKLRGWEPVSILQEMAFKMTFAQIEIETKRDRAKRKSTRT